MPGPFSLTLREDSVQVYDFSYCNPPDTYCRRTTGSSKRSAATLDVGWGTLVVGSLTYTATSDVRLDSTRVEFVYAAFPCGRYYLRAVRDGSGVTGTWSGQYDCHGLSGKGHIEPDHAPGLVLRH